MEVCPKCNRESLVYDPHIKSARCLRIECGYKEEMAHTEYSRRFEHEDKNVAHKLSFSHNHQVVAT